MIVALALFAAQLPGAAPHAHALEQLAAGEPAVESAWEAITASDRFRPEDWAGETPEGRIVLDELTVRALAAYRRERARYRVTLARALAAAGEPVGAARELRRAAALDPLPETYRALAELPGLPADERVKALLAGWSAGGGRDPTIADALAATGAFPHPDAMVAAVERFRFQSPEADRLRIPAAVELADPPFPTLSLAVPGGVWSSARSFGEGRLVVVYRPADGCGRCGEVADDLQGLLRGRAVDVLVAVEDTDLALVTRIAELAGAGFFEPEPQVASARARLGGRSIAHVVRRATLPPDFEAEATVWLAAHSGFLVFQAALGDEPVRRLLAPLLRLIDDPPFPGGTEPLVDPEDRPEALIRAVGPLEALGQPIGALEQRLAAAVRGAEDPLALLERAGSIRGGALARRRLLAARFPRIGDRLLEAAHGLDPGILRASAEGPLRTRVASGRIGVQRGYDRADGTTALLHAAIAADGAVTALAVVEGPAGGVEWSGHRFLFAHGECVSGEVPVCPARLHSGAVVVRTSQLVDSDGPPFFFRRVDGPAGPFAAGLAAFAAGDLEAAGAHFEAAVASPGSEVDPAARRYNLAVVRARLGERETALAMLEEIGDASFHPLVEAAVRELYRAIPDPPAP